MYPAFGVDDNFDVLRPQVEKSRGLYHFKSLVGHGSRIDCDLGPHVPGRVGEGVLRGDKRQSVGLEVPERAS